MRELKSYLSLPVPPDALAPLLRLQGERLRAAVPLMCVLTIANAIAMTLAVLGDLPLWQQLAPPAIIITVCLGVLLWRQVSPKALTSPRALDMVRYFTIPLGLLAGAWGVNAFTETERYYCMVAPVFVAMAAMIAASGLAAAPRAAIGAMAGAALPLVSKMMLYDNLGVRAMAVMLVIVTVMLSWLLIDKFRETVAMLSAQAALDRLVREDALTGLASRRALTDVLEARLAAGEPTTILLADVDDLKPVNDLHGHAAGDDLLCAVAMHLRAEMPEALLAARLGGDEFALVFGSPAFADAAVRRARHSPPPAFETAGGVIQPRASMGHASASNGTVEELLHRADQAMYADKAECRAAPPTVDMPALLV
jgi:diguanylate cyclase (GGDEF)-like protein